MKSYKTNLNTPKSAGERLQKSQTKKQRQVHKNSHSNTFNTHGILMKKTNNKSKKADEKPNQPNNDNNNKMG